LVSPPPQDREKPACIGFTTSFDSRRRKFPEPIEKAGRCFGGIASRVGVLVIVFLQLISWLNDEAITLRACLPDCSGAAHVAVDDYFLDRQCRNRRAYRGYGGR
jgi:hypothetical protein